MRTIISRWFLFGLLIGWSISHASVFGQPVAKSGSAATTTTTSIDKLKQGLEKTITVDFTTQSIDEVFNHLRDRSGLPISVDDQSIGMVGMNFFRPDGQPMQFQVKATNEKAGSVLRKFLNNYRLSYVIVENSILITTEEMALVRQMRQRVTVNLEDVPANKAIRDLARNHGINLVIDPGQAKQAETPVSLQADNTGIETAIRLLAELANLKAVRMGNVMFVTSEARAKKIRDEEQHQFDNPLNPNVPGSPPVVGFGGGFGGGFGMIGGGVMPMRAPGVVVPGNPGVAPPPPPGIDLPPAKDLPLPIKDGDDPVKKKVVLPVPPQPTPALPPGVERSAPARPPVPADKKSS